MDKYCPNCGAKILDWFMFCEKCGFKLDHIIEPELPPVEKNYEDKFPESSNFSTPQKNSIETTKSTENEFNNILHKINSDFNPKNVVDKNDLKRRLVEFLRSNYPHEILGEGHNSIGEKMDIVINGIYAIKLKIVKNEGGLIFLVDQILECRRDFNDIAVFLYDIDEISSEKINEYITEYYELDIKVVMKKGFIVKPIVPERETVKILWRED